MRRLPAFNLVYAAPNPAKFGRAADFFSRLFEGSERVTARHLNRYFEVRRLCDAKKYNSLTRADRDMLRDGDQRCAGDGFQSAYQKWLTGSLRPDDLDHLLEPQQPLRKGTFKPMSYPNAMRFFTPKQAATIERHPGTDVLPDVLSHVPLHVTTKLRWREGLHPRAAKPK